MVGAAALVFSPRRARTLFIAGGEQRGHGRETGADDADAGFGVTRVPVG